MSYPERMLFHNEYEESCFIDCLRFEGVQRENLKGAISYLVRLADSGSQEELNILLFDQEDTVQELKPLLGTDPPNLKGALFFLVGGLLIDKGRYRKAFNKLLYASTISGISSELYAFILSRLAFINFRQNRFQEAVDINFRLLDLCCHLAPLSDLKPLIHYRQAGAFIMLKDYEQARRQITALEQNSGLMVSGESLLVLKGFLGRCLKQYGEAAGLLEQAARRAGQGGDNLFWTDLYYQLAHCRLGTGDFAKADRCLSHGWRFLKSLETLKTSYRGKYENLAGLLELRCSGGDTSKARGCFVRAVELFEKENDQKNLGRVKRNLGRTFIAQKKYHLAVKSLNQALAHDYAISFLPGVARTFLIKASVSAELGQYKKVGGYLARIRSLDIPADQGVHGDLDRIGQTLNRELKETDAFVADSAAMKRIKADIERISGSDGIVTLVGRPGTGKRKAAELIHHSSGRRDAPFVEIDLSTVETENLDTELYGDALADADGGTVYLHDISRFKDLSLSKIKRFLKERKITPAGGGPVRSLDLRIICGTAHALSTVLDSKLSGLLTGEVLYLPPLSERRDDIVGLVKTFYKNGCREKGLDPVGFTEGAITFLRDRYPWPANLDLLKGLINHCLAKVEPGKPIGLDLVEGSLVQLEPLFVSPEKKPELSDELAALKERIKNLEKREIAPAASSKRIDRQEALETIFIFIQQQEKPVSRRRIKEALPGYSRSVNKWLNILMHDFEVIRLTDQKSNQQNRTYQAVSPEELEKAAGSGKIVRGEKGEYHLLFF